MVEEMGGLDMVDAETAFVLEEDVVEGTDEPGLFTDPAAWNFAARRLSRLLLFSLFCLCCLW